MRDHRACINVVLAAVLLMATSMFAADSSKTSGGRAAKPKLPKHIRVHVETRRDIPERSMTAEVGRSNPMKFTVEKLPILNEIHVENVALIDEQGGFQVRIQFDRLGTQLLENYTSAAAGRHLLVMTDIDGEARWIAAPLIRRRIGDGILAFSPTATREEMDRLVRGLNQEVEKKRKQWLN